MYRNHLEQLILVTAVKVEREGFALGWTTRDIMEHWPDYTSKRGYTTVKTVIDRLCDKKLIERKGREHLQIHTGGTKRLKYTLVPDAFELWARDVVMTFIALYEGDCHEARTEFNRIMTDIEKESLWTPFTPEE